MDPVLAAWASIEGAVLTHRVSHAHPGLDTIIILFGSCYLPWSGHPSIIAILILQSQACPQMVVVQSYILVILY